MRDYGAFGRSMDRLAAAFNRPPSEATKDAYRDALSGVTDDEFQTAVSKALTACERWPVPKVLLGFALDERRRMRVIGHGPVPVESELPHCPTCGATVAWHTITTPTGKDTERMLIRHGTGKPCERFNESHRFVATP